MNHPCSSRKLPGNTKRHDQASRKLRKASQQMQDPYFQFDAQRERERDRETERYTETERQRERERHITKDTDRQR